VGARGKKRTVFGPHLQSARGSPSSRRFHGARTESKPFSGRSRPWCPLVRLLRHQGHVRRSGLGTPLALQVYRRYSNDWVSPPAAERNTK
jgi:hypothetical protein